MCAAKGSRAYAKTAVRKREPAPRHATNAVACVLNIRRAKSADQQLVKVTFF